MTAFLADYLSAPLAAVVAALVAAGLIVSFVGVAAFLFIWAERKVSARIQDRLGPTRAGPLGLLQSLADGIKLITKEDFAPAGADKVLFRVAPYLAFVASFVAFVSLPFADGVIAHPLGIGVFFVLAALSGEVFGILLAGYASGSKWSLFGGIREAAQVVSYEVPRSLCVLVPVCIAGTLDLTRFAHLQGGWFWNWYVFHDPFTFAAFVVFFIVGTASCKRAPFDLAEAESELVGGFHTEYSGIRWSYFFLAEYGSMFAVSAIAAYLFLGGWHTGVLPFDPATEWGYVGTAFNVGVVIAKGAVLIFVMMWVRWSMPRLRIDQVMTTCLKYFLPIGCGLLIGVCGWQLLVPPAAGRVVAMVLGGGTLAFVLVAGLSLLRPARGFVTGRELGGAWGPGERPA